MVEVSEQERVYLGKLGEWIMNYVDIRKAYYDKPFVYIDAESFYTPLVINEEWIKNELDGYKTTIYSNKELVNDDVLRTIKKFIHLLPVIRTIETKSNKEHLKELVLVELPVVDEYGDNLNTVLLDIFLNVNAKSCMRYGKMYDLHGLYNDEYLYCNFACCLITNANKTKLYGRTWYHSERQVLMNTYHYEVKEALLTCYHYKEINTNVNRHLYINELIYLNNKYVKPHKIEGLDMLMDNLKKCDCCGEYYDEETMYHLGNGDCYCDSCAHEYLGYCSYCDNEYDLRNTHIYQLRDNEQICEWCLGERLIRL